LEDYDELDLALGPLDGIQSVRWLIWRDHPPEELHQTTKFQHSGVTAATHKVTLTISKAGDRIARARAWG
jgi:hypothetical protein